MKIRRAEAADSAAIAAIAVPVIRAGETNALDRDMSEADAVAYWMGADKETFVAVEEGVVVGTYWIRPNQAGGGRHVCNGGYMTSAAATGRGVARRMCEHSIAYARERGYRAMQFNFVVSTNERAVSLWQSLGFEIVGRLPGAFAHPSKGEVDVFVMYRRLEVFEHQGERWLLRAAHAGSERVRASPFEAVELDLSRLWRPKTP